MKNTNQSQFPKRKPLKLFQTLNIILEYPQPKHTCHTHYHKSIDSIVECAIIPVHQESIKQYLSIMYTMESYALNNTPCLQSMVVVTPRSKFDIEEDIDIISKNYKGRDHIIFGIREPYYTKSGFNNVALLLKGTREDPWYFSTRWGHE